MRTNEKARRRRLREVVSTSAAPAQLRDRLRGVSQEKVVLLAAVALLILFGATIPDFARLDNFITMVRSVAILGMLGIAMALVVIPGGLDLSLVATMGITSGFAMRLLGVGEGTVTALFLGLFLALAIGLLNGWLVAFVEIPALFATLGVALFLDGFGQAVILRTRSISLPTEGADLLLRLGRGQLLGLPMPVVWLIVLVLLSHLLLSRIRIGRFLYAQGDNPEAASLSGIALRPLTVLQYVVAAVIAYGVGLVLAGAAGGFQVSVGRQFSQIFDVILVVVLGGVSLRGGRGGVFNVMAGTLLIGVMLNGMTHLDMDVEQQTIVKSTILLAALAMDQKLHPRDEETARQEI